MVIGPGGKNVREFRDKMGVSVWVHEGGKVSLTSQSREAIEEVKKIIQNLIAEIEVGKVYKGKITRVEPYGVFVEVLPGKVGLLHVSKMEGYVRDVRSKFSVGDEILVKVIEVDDQGRPKLTNMGIEQPA